MNRKIINVIDLVPGNRYFLESVEASSLSAELFWTRFVRKHTPVIIKGAASHWAALKRWTQAGYLESLCDGEIVDVWSTFNASPPLDSAAAKLENLFDSVVKLRAAPDDSTYSIPAMPVPERWRSDLGAYSFLSNKYERAPLWYPRDRLFVYKNASTDWHYHHLDETITTQLLGSKRVSLFRLTADNWRAFAPLIAANWHHIPCRGDFFPREVPLSKYEGLLDAGDAIYIPPFWWHGIDPLDTNMGATLAHCFRSPVGRFGAWQEPGTKELIRLAAKSHKIQLLPLLTLVSVSSIARRFDREAWWPV